MKAPFVRNLGAAVLAMLATLTVMAAALAPAITDTRSGLDAAHGWHDAGEGRAKQGRGSERRGTRTGAAESGHASSKHRAAQERHATEAAAGGAT
jgi:hypothetical protein